MALAAIVVAALLVRTLPRLDVTFDPSGLRCGDPDSWHHLRQIEQWVRHFPARMTYDAYALHPGGQGVPVAPLFDGLVATVAWLLGAGSPSRETVHAAAAWASPVLGALTCVPVFALGRRLAGTAGGLVAAFATALLPGQFLTRSLLGFADHHALETFLAATALALFTAALADADSDPRRSRRAAVLGGVAVGLHLLAWTGGALLVAGLAAGGAACVVADVLRDRDPSRPAARVAAGLAVAALLLLVFRTHVQTADVGLLALAAAVVGVLSMASISGLLRTAGLGPGAAAAVTVVAASSLTLTAVAVVPRAEEIVSAAFGWFSATGTRVTVAEARPLLLEDSGLSLFPLWTEFGAPGLAAVPGLVALAVRLVRGARRADVVVAVAAAGGLALTFAQVRFAAWGALAVATLAAVALGPWLGRAWRGESAQTPAWLGRGVWPASIAIGLVVPTAPLLSWSVAAPGSPSDAWYEALTFLRERTAEPFGDAAAFERLDAAPDPATNAGGRPPPAHGVLAWWDAGYWITAIARRVPLANPTQAGAGEVAKVLLATDPARAAQEADRLGARYVVVDDELPFLERGLVLSGRLTQLAAWAGKPGESLVRTFRDPLDDGSYAEFALFGPDYYRSLAVRLAVFGGRAAPAGEVIGVVWRETEDGAAELVEQEFFETHGDAEDWAASRAPQRTFIGSSDPCDSCVPLEAVREFRRVFSSSDAAPVLSREAVWSVQVWERAD